MHSDFDPSRSAYWLWAGLCLCLLWGCTEPQSTVDTVPFKSAIADYLQRNNMALQLKRIKQGPTVTGDTAKLTASLTPAQVGGPSVTWDFLFEQSRDGSWRVIQHER